MFYVSPQLTYLEQYEKLRQRSIDPSRNWEPVQPDNGQAKNPHSRCQGKEAYVSESNASSEHCISSVSSECSAASQHSRSPEHYISSVASPRSASSQRSGFSQQRSVPQQHSAGRARDSDEWHCHKHSLNRPLATKDPKAVKLTNINLIQALWFKGSSSSRSHSVWTPEENTILNNWKNNGIGPENRVKAVDILTQFKKKGKSKLNFSKLSLKGLPPVLFRMNIKELDISNNYIENLDPLIEKITGLVSLNASGNSMRSVPDELGELHNLKHLDLSNNKLSFLPTSFDTLQNLETLKLDHNLFEYLPTEIADLSKLSTLSISHNQLEQAPDIMNRMQGLLDLDMSHNKICRVSKVWDILLTKLITLNLSNNIITELPFNNVPDALKLLDLSDNPIADLPRKFGAIMWTEKGRLKTTSRNRGNMRIVVDNTNIVAGLHAEGRLELKEENYMQQLPPDLRPPPAGGSLGDDDFSDIDPAEWGVGPLPSGGVEGISGIEPPDMNEDGEIVSPDRTTEEQIAKFIEKMHGVEDWILNEEKSESAKEKKKKNVSFA